MANLVVNNDFEVDVSGWKVATNCTIAQSTLQANTGAACLAMTATATGNMQATINAPYAVVVEGHTYTLTYAVRAATIGRSTYLSIDWLNASSTYLSSSAKTSTADVTTGWVLVTISGKAPPTAVLAVPGSYFLAPAAGEVHYTDTVDFHEAPPGFFASVGKPGPRVSNRTGGLQGGY